MRNPIKLIDSCVWVIIVGFIMDLFWPKILPHWTHTIPAWVIVGGAFGIIGALIWQGLEKK